MATTVLPLNLDPADEAAAAELERILMGLDADAYAELAESVARAVRTTPPQDRHRLALVEHVDDTHLIEPLVWDGDRLVSRRRTVAVELLPA